MEGIDLSDQTGSVVNLQQYHDLCSITSTIMKKTSLQNSLHLKKLLILRNVVHKSSWPL